ncbi:hypothetical protein ABZW49_05405 [Nonomuraea wenchangensis]
MIWRRLLVSSGITPDRLHAVLVAAMGWKGGSQRAVSCTTNWPPSGT